MTVSIAELDTNLYEQIPGTHKRFDKCEHGIHTDHKKCSGVIYKDDDTVYCNCPCHEDLRFGGIVFVVNFRNINEVYARKSDLVHFETLPVEQASGVSGD